VQSFWLDSFGAERDDLSDQADARWFGQQAAGLFEGKLSSA
jgi:hypothetical protein